MNRLAAIAYTILVVIVSNFWLVQVDAQTTKIKTSWNVIEELHILSNSVASLEAKIEGHAALLNNSVSSLEAKIERQAALLNNVVDNVLARLEASVIGQAASMNNAVISAVTTLEAKVEGQAVLLNNVVTNALVSLETRIDGKAVLLNALVNNAVAKVEAKVEEQAELLNNAASNALRSLEAKIQVSLNTSAKNSVAILEAKIEGLTASLNNAVNNSVANLEAIIDGRAVSLNTSVNNAVASLEAKSEEQAAGWHNFVSKEEWQQPVSLYTTTRTIVALNGEDVDIWCVVHGTPLPEIKWTKENGKLASHRVQFANNGKVLRIKHVRSRDQGTYVCVASNGVGTPVSQSVSLEVNGSFTATGLFAATTTGLISLDLRTLEATAITSVNADAVAVNNKLNKVYWSENPNGIMRSNFDGSSKEIIVPKKGDTIYMLYIDEPSGNLYFARYSYNEITVCNALGENCAAVMSNSSLVHQPIGVALDSANGVMYWGGRGSPRALVRANLDGSNAAVILTAFNTFFGITLDPRLNGVLYWTDIDNNTIGTIDVNGGNQRTLMKLEGNPGPWGIQVDSHEIYIGNYYSKNIQTADRDSGKELTTIFNSCGNVRQLAFFDASA